MKKDFSNPSNFLWIENISKRDLENFRTFTLLKKLDDNKITTYSLAKKLGRSYSTVYGWRNELRLPKLAHWSNLYTKLEKPKENHKLLWMNLGYKIIPSEKPIEVPLEIKGWNDVKKVIKQLAPIENNLEISKEECFAFVLGMTIGDVGKLSKNRDRLDLQLTKEIDTNEMLGEFFCKCLRKLGLRSHRIKDNRNKFRWHSQSSPFFQWIYNTLLGLKNEENTTYNSVKVDWILDTPKVFIKRFLQGIFESDGSVLYDDRITCAAYPNAEIIQRLLEKFNIKSYIINDKGWKRTNIEGFENLRKSNNILFAPEIKTKRFKLLERIVNSNKTNGKRTPIKIRNNVIDLYNKGFKNYQISKLLLERHNFALSRRTIQRIINKEVEHA
jgi:hypothetical protein